MPSLNQSEHFLQDANLTMLDVSITIRVWVVLYPLYRCIDDALVDNQLIAEELHRIEVL